MTDAPKAIFLSYARDDAGAARRIAEALRSHGLEVWFDENELRGGDAWDAKIRKQINDCSLFMPIISQHTEARNKGYFRLEWKLAVEQTHLMLEGVPFLAPVVIDDTRETGAAVPAEFLRVQWTRLPGALPTPQFVEQIRRLIEPQGGGGRTPDAGRQTPDAGGRKPEAGRQRSEDGELRTENGDQRSVSARRVTPWLVVAVAALAIGIGGYFTLRPNPAASAAPTPSPNPKSVAAKPLMDFANAKSIAVLAFENMSADKDTEYFSDGIAEEILNSLARDPSLRVAARTSSFTFKGRKVPIEEIGRALHVASVIEGSVRRSGNTVRITVQLINAADGYHVWSETFTREMTDIFAVQDEIARNVAQRLAGKSASATVTVAAITAAPTKNLAAYDAYLRGRALHMGGLTVVNRLEIVRLYEQAVALDPSYALAWARLSQIIMRNRLGGADRSEQNAVKCRNAAATALRLAPDLPEAHLAMAAVRLSIDFDLEAAQRELDEAERLRPNEPEVPAMRCRLEHARGHWGEPLAKLVARATELDPQNADLHTTAGIMLSRAGRFAEAERFLSHSWALSQESHSPMRFRAYNLQAWSGDTQAALSFL